MEGGLLISFDHCPAVNNSDQKDHDVDRVGDKCDHTDALAEKK